MHDSGVARITAVTCAFVSRQSPRYTYGGSTISPSHPARCASLASATASAVLDAEMPATRKEPARSAVRHVSRIRTFSSNDSAGASPNDPSGTMPWAPLATIHAACSHKNSWSTLRSSWNGVVIAGKTPRQS